MGIKNIKPFKNVCVSFYIVIISFSGKLDLYKYRVEENLIQQETLGTTEFPINMRNIFRIGCLDGYLMIKGKCRQIQ